MTTLTFQVGASNRDGDQNTPGGDAGNITRALLRFGNDTNPKIVGVGFTGVNIAQGTTITSATLKVTGGFSYDSPGTIAMNVYGEAANNSAVFTANNNNFTNRSRTTEVTAFNQDPVTIDVEYSIDVTAQVQAILNRAGWASGNALSLLAVDNGSTFDEWQEYYSWDGSTTKCAKLVIVVPDATTLPVMPKQAPENVLLRM